MYVLERNLLCLLGCIISLKINHLNGSVYTFFLLVCMCVRQYTGASQ